MRFLSLLAEVTAGVGTLLSSHCPETGAALPKHNLGIGTACAVWGKTVDTVLNPVGHAFLIMKEGSVAGWDGAIIRKWRGGLLAAADDDDWSYHISFINDSITNHNAINILDTGGTTDIASLALDSSTRTESVEYDGPKDIILAPCIICKSLSDSPTTIPDNTSATMAAVDVDVEPEPLATSEQVEGMLRFIAFAIVFWVSHIWIMLNAARPNIINTHVTPVICKWIARPLLDFLEYIGWISFGQPIPWDVNRKFFVVTKDGTYRSMAFLSRMDYILLDCTPVDEEEEEEEEDIHVVDDVPAEREPPAPLWNPNMHVSTSGPRQTRRGQKKAAKKSKAKKRG